MSDAFGIVGGDLRQLHLAQSIAEDGCPVYTACLENAAGSFGLPRLGLGELAGKCEVVVLPLPASRDGRYLNTPLSDQDIWLDDGFARLFAGKRVFGGMLGKLKGSSALWRISLPRLPWAWQFRNIQEPCWAPTVWLLALAVLARLYVPCSAAWGLR